MAYNTKLVPPEQVPNSYVDLLHPRWAGKLVIELSDIEWLASVTKSMGEEKGLAYFKKLAAQKPMMRDGHTLLAEMLASGEIAIVLTAFNHSIDKLKQKQAPVDWKPLQPAFGQASAVGLARQAPHPYAALLFADFLLSKTGQEIIKERGRVPVSLAVDSPLNKFQYQLIDTAVVLDEWDKWQRLWSDLFFEGKAVAHREEKAGSGG
jgi:iron(III) transport system substrate-binding protein